MSVSVRVKRMAFLMHIKEKCELKDILKGWCYVEKVQLGIIRLVCAAQRRFGEAV